MYGLGGWLALGGQLAAGDVVVLALLLTRLYAPLTALSNARVEIMSALVSFERVFEILDLKPLIQQKPDAVEVPPGPVSVEFDDVRFAYPSADKVSLASLEDVSTLDTRGGEEVLHGISFRVEPGQTVALVGFLGGRQVHHRPVAVTAVRRRFRRRAPRRHTARHRPGRPRRHL